MEVSEEGGVTIASALYVGSSTHITMTNMMMVGMVTMTMHSLKCNRQLLRILSNNSINVKFSCFSSIIQHLPQRSPPYPNALSSTDISLNPAAA